MKKLTNDNDMDFEVIKTNNDNHGIKNAMSVDVEDYYQVSAFEGSIERKNWGEMQSRVESNTDRILAMFDEHDIKATFFILGCIAENYPALIRRIVNNGHEVASHGYSHIRVINQNQKQFREDVVKTKNILEDISGCEVKGYRAASYSINSTNLWALGILKETGHIYSSSIYPVKHDIYGMPEAPRYPFKHRKYGIIEIPITTIKLAGRNFPCGGGGYFRLLPYYFSRWALRHVNKLDYMSGVFYFHPWEIDPDQPKIIGLNPKTKFRHYTNLKKMETKIRKLLIEFSWGRMDEIFLPGL
jgi:polysaccharide deacetylase family protein (PEP-CTERM system associated)